MKRLLFNLCLLVTLLVPASQVKAQNPPHHRVVTVIVSPDRTDWKYQSGQQATFNIHVYKNENLLKDVVIDYELGPEYFPTEKKENVTLKDGRLTVKSSMKEPGFLRCRVIAKVDGRAYEGLATVAYDETKIQPTTQEPVDFDTFWQNAIQEARKTALDPKMVLLPERCTETQNVYHVSFQNEKQNSRIYGILMVPKKPGKYPAILQVPGAGIRPYGGANYGDDIISLEIGIHGIPVNMPQQVYNDLQEGALSAYFMFSMNNRDQHYYKRVYLGCVRAVDFIYQLPEFDGETIGVSGGSQGGALSIVTAGLEPRIKFLAAFYPAMCDFSGYLNNRAGGWPHYYQNRKPAPNEVETLSYFDVVNFARKVQAPGWYCWGYNDVVCPPTSMYAAYNVIPGPKELDLFLETGHWTFPEQHMAQKRFVDRMLGR